MDNSDQLSDDQLIASAAQFLIDGGEEDAASVLLSCKVNVHLLTPAYVRDEWANYIPADEGELCIELVGSRAAHDILDDKNHPVRHAIQRAFSAVSSRNWPVTQLEVRVTRHSLLTPEWHKELLDIARGNGVSNQAIMAGDHKVITWNQLRFRSESERRIAAALDSMMVLFLPNCRARLGLDSNRQNREADFLVCHEGKWGILEVDGEPFHPPSRTVEDHERDRMFKQHGIHVVEHFDAPQCYDAPQAVVKKFLNILKQS